MKRLLLVSTLVHAGILAAGAVIKPRPLALPGDDTRVVMLDFDLAAPTAPPVAAAPVAAPPPRTESLAPRPEPEPSRALTREPRTAPAPAPAREARLARLAPAPAPAPEAPPPAPVAPLPAPAPAAPAAPPMNVARLLSTSASDVASIGDPSVRAPSSATPGGTDSSDGTGSDATRERRDQARAAAQGYVAEVIANANQLEPSQVHAYYGSLARRMRETWRPGFYRTPGMVDALLALPRAMVHYREMYRRRAARFANTGRPDDPTQMDAMPSFEDRQSFAAAITSTIIEVEQDEDGRVLSMRVIRPARVHDFDEAALAAVRAALPDTTAVHMPGGRRSRFAFDVVASRDPILPVAGLTFNESNGFFEMNYPGALHVRTRIRPLGSRPLDAPWSAPHPRAD